MPAAARRGPRETDQVRTGRGTLDASPAFLERRGGASRPPSIARPLRALAVLLVLAIIGVTAQQLLSARASVLATAGQQITQLDAILADQTARAFELVDAALREAVRAWDDGTPPAEVAAALQHRAAALKQVAATGIVDPQARPPPAVPDAVRRLLAAGQPGLAISPPERAAAGGWRAYVARPRAAAAGAPPGLVYAAINLGFFDEMYSAAELSRDGAVVLLSRDGILLMRTPLGNRPLGDRYVHFGALHDATAKDRVSLITLNRPTDDTDRLVAVRPLRDAPAIVTVSLSRQVVLASWRRSAAVFTALAFAACASITLLMLVLADRSRELDRMYQDVRGAKDTADAANRELRRQMADREQAEAALREAQRAEAIGQLTRGVAHDFNNLLAVVLGNIDLMAAAHRDDPAVQKRLATMRAAAERGATLTGQLMAFARRQPLHPRAVDLNEVVASMQPLLASAVGSRIRVELALTPDLPPARVDPTQIELAILNLAINARDAMTSGGVLTVATGRAPLGDADTQPGTAPEGVALSVRDTGPGMAPEVRAKAFEPFFTTKGPGRGSGLGLSQVHGLAYQSGGWARLASAAGEGTRVDICLPVAAEIEPAPAAPETAAPAASAPAARVLLVDDDGPVRETAAAVLEAEGYDVTEAADAAEALRLLRGGAVFDVLVSDVVMPGMSGPELIRELHCFLPDLPAVLISGYSEPAELAASGVPGFFVRKPFTPGALTGTIQAAISERPAAA